MRKLRCRAKAIPDSHVFGYANTGTEQVGILVECLDGEFKGKQFTWYGFFTPAAEERTLEQLMIAGWDGTDVINLPGLGTTEFELQLEEQEDHDENGSPAGTFWRPTFINRIGVAMRNQMDDQQKRAFAARLNALARNMRGGAAQQQRQQRAAKDDILF